MAETPRPPRSGCAVISGVFLITVGSLFLASNVLGSMGVSPLRAGIQTLVWFGTYWPVLLIAWGIYKVYQRFRSPESSHVTSLEVVALVWILVMGLAIRGVGRMVTELGVHASVDDFAGLLGPALLGPAHRIFEEETFDPGSAAVLVVENPSGQVVVSGSDEATLQVRLVKQIRSFSEADAMRALSSVDLEFHAGDERAQLSLSDDDSRAIRTDLEIRVPKTLSLKIVNHHGGVRIEGVEAPAEVTTANGDVEAVNLTAGIDVETRRATIRLEQISGGTKARNEHGDIHAISIVGDVSAITEHATIITEHVDGSVTLRTEHGTVRATDVTGNVEVASPYSEVSVERSGGSVSIVSSHRPVFVYEIARGLEIVAPYARTLVRGVDGDASIETRHGRVSVADVQGIVSVTGEHNEVDVASVRGNVAVESSHEDVRVSDFGSALTIQTVHADVEVVAHRLAGAVRVETSYGDVSIGLPANASVELVATTRDGELRSELFELTKTGERRQREQRWEGALGTGAHRVSLATSYGNIAITQVRPRS